MKYFRLKEIHDYKFAPAFLRNGLTDFLSFLLLRYSIYVPTISLFKKVFTATGCYHIVDLCSGGGGPYQQLLPLMNQQVSDQVTLSLTDIKPNLPAFLHLKAQFPNQVDYTAESVDLRSFNMNKKGVLTLFSSFHHFSEDDVINLLTNTARQKLPICVFEFTENRFSRYVMDLLAVPLSVLIFMPRVKNFSILRLIFTYILPIFPIMICVDSLISNFYSYSPQHLKHIATQIESSYYHWESGKIKSGLRFFNITYLIGYPCNEVN